MKNIQPLAVKEMPIKTILRFVVGRLLVPDELQPGRQRNPSFLNWFWSVFILGKQTRIVDNNYSSVH